MLNAWEVAYFKGAFSKMDIDGDGFLLLNEVYELLTDLNEEPRSIEVRLYCRLPHPLVGYSITPPLPRPDVGCARPKRWAR